MKINNCAESQTRICKAFISDCYGHLAKSVNGCVGAERQILKNNIFGMLDRIKDLLDNSKTEYQSRSVEESEPNPVEETE